MIRREADGRWLLVSQVDHARLAAEIARVWGHPQSGVPTLPVAESLVQAIRLHDDGWYEWEAAPEVDPSTGRPRDFTEMPMAEAAAIWSRSIEIAGRGAFPVAEATERFESWLAGTGRTLTPLRAAVLEAALDFPSRFDANEWRESLGEETWREARFDGTPELLREAGLVESLGERFAVTLEPAAAPLCGTWVSRHFTRLAEQAAENRKVETEVEAAERFCAEQEERRRAWRPAVDAYAEDDAERLIEGGYRLLRFFDWVSLWICCAERSEGTDMALPGGPTIHLEPAGPTHFRLHPWPLAIRHLWVAVPCLAIPAAPLADDAALREALVHADRTTLDWELVPG